MVILYVHVIEVYMLVERDGIIEAEVVSRAVPTSVLKEILMWKEGCTVEDVVSRQRVRTVSSGYDDQTWLEA